MSGSVSPGHRARNLPAGTWTSERDRQRPLTTAKRSIALLICLRYAQPTAQARLSGIRCHLLDVEVVPVPGRLWLRKFLPVCRHRPGLGLRL